MEGDSLNILWEIQLCTCWENPLYSLLPLRIIQNRPKKSQGNTSSHELIIILHLSMFMPASGKFAWEFKCFDFSITTDKMQGAWAPIAGLPTCEFPKPTYLSTAATVFWSPKVHLLGAQTLFRSIKVPWAKCMSFPLMFFYVWVACNAFTVKKT